MYTQKSYGNFQSEVWMLGQGMVRLWKITTASSIGSIAGLALRKVPKFECWVEMLMDTYLKFISFFLIPIQNVDHFHSYWGFNSKSDGNVDGFERPRDEMINAPDPAGQFLIHQPRTQANYKFEMISAYTNQLLLPLLLL